MFGTTAFGTRFPFIVDRPGIGKPKLEDDAFLTKANRFGRVLNAVVDLVGYELL